MVTISVIMGVLCSSDRLTLLKRAVKSILEQTYSDFELIICGYGSSYDVIAYLNEAALSDCRIRIVNECRLTLPEKLNCCLKYANGTYIARMDDDDFSMPYRFEKQIEFLNSHKEIAFVGSSAAVVCSGEKLGTYSFPEYPQANDFLFSQPFIHPTLMFRREAMTAVGGYSQDKRCILCEDYDILMRMYAAGLKGANIREELLEYTVSKGLNSKRKLKHRINECVIRFRRFRDNGLLAGHLVYVIKPIAVWLIPECLLGKIKKRRLDRKK